MPDSPTTAEIGSVLYRLLFETNPQPALVFDRSTLAILSANAAAVRHYRYSAEEFRGKTIGDLSPLEELPRLLDQLRRLCTEDAGAGMVELGAFRHRRKDGRPLDVEISAGRMGLRGREAFLVLISDITERTLAEEALWQSTAYLRRIVTTMPVVLWATDRNGVFTLSEGLGLAALGLRPREVVGQSVFELYRNNPQIIESVHRALAGESFREAITLGPMTFDSFFSPVRGDAGEVEGVVGVSTDVTAHRAAEQALRNSEARFFKAFQSSPAALTISTLKDGRYLHVNDSYIRLLGYSREELVGRRVTDFPFWPSTVVRGQAIDQLRAAGFLRDFPLVVTTKSGDVRDLLVSLEIVELEGEACLLGMSQDVTERLAAERALEAQRAFLKQVVDINPDFVFAKDRLGRFTLANRVLAEAYGTTVESLLGKTDADFATDPVEAAAFHRNDLEVMDTGREKLIAEEVITDAHGKKRWLRTIKRPLLDANGVATQVLGVAIDITARKRAEEALRDAAQLSREIVSSAADGIFVCDADLRYQVWNRAMEDMTGRLEESVLGRSAADAFSEFHDRGVIQLLEQALAGAIIDSPDIPITIRGQAEPRWLSGRYRPLRESKGAVVGVVGVVRDVTDRRKA